jgi:osmotically-inducible protein OsmY
MRCRLAEGISHQPRLTEEFMNQSSTLQHDVEEELRWDPRVQAEEIGVTVKNEVVQLDGRVNSLFEKWAAENTALRVKNVKAVANDIKVDVLESDKRSDADIAEAAINHLEWNYTIPSTVKVKVSNGWVTFVGTVEAPYQRDEAERVLHTLRGVKGIVNDITVKPRVNLAVVKTEILDALTRNAAVDAKAIQVEESGGVVTLRGRVRSWSERVEARRSASGAPGVTLVEDCLEVVPL